MTWSCSYMSKFRFEVWPTEHRVITQPFGANAHYYRQFGLPGHEGVDLRAPTGSKIYCVARGRVYKVQNNPEGHNYGIHVRVQHEDGYVTVYAHLQEAFVAVGDAVKGGSVLGLADNTGNSFGSHLHLMLKKRGAKVGDWPKDMIDPTPFLLPLMGWKTPVGPFLKGWVAELSVSVNEDLELAQALSGGVTLRMGPNEAVQVPEGTLMVVNGPPQSGFLPVLAAAAAVGQYQPPTETPGTPPASHETTIQGWVWKSYLNIEGQLGVVNTRYGINCRERATRNSTNLGIIRRGSTLMIQGEEENGYLPIIARQADFIGPVNAPQAPQPTLPSTGGTNGNGNSVGTPPGGDGIHLGWLPTQFLQIAGLRAETPHRPVSLQSAPGSSGRYMGTIRSNTSVTIAGQAEANYTPVLVNEQGFLRVLNPLPVVELPEPLTEDEVEAAGDSTLMPLQKSTPGWVLSGELRLRGVDAKAGPDGLNLREAPRRDAKIVGFVPAQSQLFVTDTPLGEFTPVRIDESILQPPTPQISQGGMIRAESSQLSVAKIGLHASADPHISEAEHAEFAAMRPGIIKILSFHPAGDINRLTKAHPNASWIVRAFLDFGGRRLTPRQFLTDTFPDVQRALEQLRGKDVVIELHNEPNLYAEGLGASWADGTAFNAWWLELLQIYRQALPTGRFIFPGLSPGNKVHAIKDDHIVFAEACRPAIEAADGLGVHLYWSKVYPLEKSLDVLDDYLSRFRGMPLWITEASNNKGGVTVTQKAAEYLLFWRELQQRPRVQGVTYFVASASDPKFKEEVWVGRGLGQKIGLR